MISGKAPATKPSLLVCSLCGQQFGSSSLGIHQPQCFAKRMQAWKSGDTATRGPKPRFPSASDPSPTAVTQGSDAVDAFNAEQFREFQRNLAPCHNCGRKFFPDRLEVHLRSCKPTGKSAPAPPAAAHRDAKPAPPSHTQKPLGLVCYLCGQQFGTASLAIHVPRCYQKRLLQWDHGDAATRGPRPRDPATAATMPAAPTGSAGMAAFNDAAYHTFQENLSPCLTCGRRFAPDRLAVHLRSCHPNARGGGSKPIHRPPPEAAAADQDASPMDSDAGEESEQGSEDGSAEEAEEEQEAEPCAAGPPGIQDGGAVASCGKCGLRVPAAQRKRHEAACVPGKGRGKRSDQGRGLPSPASTVPEPPPKSRWRTPHEAVAASERAPGGSPDDVPPPPPAEEDDNHVLCPTCGRRFNALAAARHLPICAATVHRPKGPPQRSPASATPKPKAPATSPPAPRPSATPALPPLPAAPPPPDAPRAPGASGPPAALRARFCSECGVQFAISTAKFCCECGTQRT